MINSEDLYQDINELLQAYLGLLDRIIVLSRESHEVARARELKAVALRLRINLRERADRPFQDTQADLIERFLPVLTWALPTR